MTTEPSRDRWRSVLRAQGVMPIPWEDIEQKALGGQRLWGHETEEECTAFEISLEKVGDWLMKNRTNGRWDMGAGVSREGSGTQKVTCVEGAIKRFSEGLGQMEHEHPNPAGAGTDRRAPCWGCRHTGRLEQPGDRKGS